MPIRNTAPILPLLSLLLLVGCGDGPSGASSQSSDAASSSSSDPSVALTPGDSPLAQTANPNFATTVYQCWKPFHFTTMEREAEAYPSIAQDFNEVFPPQYQPAARVIWTAQTSGNYKIPCSVVDATINSMKSRACTASEGIGFGMLLTYFHGDDDAFLRLWNYSRAFRAHFNAALTPGITSSFRGPEVDGGSSSGADLDIAAALILMHYKTKLPEYLQDALTIADAVWNEEVDAVTFLLAPGNGDWTTSSGTVYSFVRFSPVALRLLAAVDPKHNWNAVLNNMYDLLQCAQSAGTGVLPNWSNLACVAVEPPAASGTNEWRTFHLFGQEASLVSWRLAWDWLWYRDSRAGDALTKLNTFISTKAAGNPGSPALGTLYSWNADQADKESTSVPAPLFGAWCATGVAGNAAWLNACTSLLNTSVPLNKGSSYFQDAALALYSTLLNGLFVRPF